MQYAVRRLINSVWTVGFTLNGDGTVTIHSFDRKNPIGYEQERTLPKARLIEDSDRTVIGMKLADEVTNSLKSIDELPHREFIVSNPQHVFSYSS